MDKLIIFTRRLYESCILLGARARAKGQFAKLLLITTDRCRFQTGDILRVAVKAELRSAKKPGLYGCRRLVPDSIIMQNYGSALQEPDCAKRFHSDGFPRTISSGRELKKLLTKLSITLDLVVNLDIPREVISGPAHHPQDLLQCLLPGDLQRQDQSPQCGRNLQKMRKAHHSAG